MTLRPVHARFAGVVAPTQEDEEALATARGIAELVAASPMQALDGRSTRRLQQALTEIQPLVPELLPGVIATGTNPPHCIADLEKALLKAVCVLRRPVKGILHLIIPGIVLRRLLLFLYMGCVGAP
jgi:hypothetical protein